MNKRIDENFLKGKIGLPKGESAYLFFGNLGADLDRIIKYFASNLATYPEDILKIEIDSEGKKKEILIKQIREAIHFANISSGGGGKIIVICEADKMNLEAGNALLKTLEEPPRNVVILLFSKTERILPTIKSRCKIISSWEKEDGQNIDDFKLFINKSFVEQSEEIERVVKSGEVKDFLSRFRDLAEELLLQERKLSNVKLLEEIEWAESSIRRNANARLVLENLVLQNKKVLTGA